MHVCVSCDDVVMYIHRAKEKEKTEEEKKRQVLTSAGSVGPTEDGALLYRSEGSEQLSHIVFSLLLA